MTTGEWDRIFEEAKDLGISFVFLAGGDVGCLLARIALHGRFSSLIFNGLLIFFFLQERHHDVAFGGVCFHMDPAGHFRFLQHGQRLVVIQPPDDL